MSRGGRVKGHFLDIGLELAPAHWHTCVKGLYLSVSILLNLQGSLVFHFKLIYGVLCVHTDSHYSQQMIIPLQNCGPSSA